MKLSFSQRKGIEPVKSVLQVDSMDDDLRNGLWNALNIVYWDRVKQMDIHREVHLLTKKIWFSYFKLPLDEMAVYTIDNIITMRTYFFKCPWNEVYDFIEFIANNYLDEDNSVNPTFIDFCNAVLKQELSAYRFVGRTIIQLTSEQEIAEIEEALEAKSPKPVTIHLRTALDLLADRKSPDYRNSIKESISAVEAICCSITGNSKVITLGQALNAIERDGKVDLDRALKSAFSRLYGYTSDAEGIRHALLDEPNLDFEDAKFMLVSCSAFINYLRAKSSKAGIKL